MPRWIAVLLTAVVLMIGAACGGDDDQADAADVNGADESPPAATATEEADVGTSGAAVPDFPIDAAPGATRAELVSDVQMQLEYPGDDVERVVRFYEEWTEADASTYERFDGEDGSVGWRNAEAQGNGFRAISVAQFAVGPDAERVTIVVLIAD